MEFDSTQQTDGQKMYKATMTMHMVILTDRSLDEIKFLLDFWSLDDFRRAIDSEDILATYHCDNIELVPQERTQIEMRKAGFNPDEHRVEDDCKPIERNEDPS